MYPYHSEYTEYCLAIYCSTDIDASVPLRGFPLQAQQTWFIMFIQTQLKSSEQAAIFKMKQYVIKADLSLEYLTLYKQVGITNILFLSHLLSLSVVKSLKFNIQ